MQPCDYNDEHHFAAATHYYDTVGVGRRYLCQRDAEQFGYPPYLVQLQPDPWRPRYAYLVNALTGEGVSSPTADVWTFTEPRTVEWLEAVGCKDPLVLADAAWEPYRAHLAEAAGLTIECTRVTCLPLV
ncbi:hypothetical protein [Streptomyces sp. NPDC051546]|uniref:hypothetical protein n=1 Tax=Streptomyces sp. NPDC051546 TaxID=3365655 RepID=UPI0037A1DD47